MRFNDPILIRSATVADIPGLARIVNDCAEFGLMLHRSHSFLYEKVRDFTVAIDTSVQPAIGDGDGDGPAMPADGQVVGVCGLSIIWANLAEVYSLAVAPSHRRRGLGQRLVLACVEDARRVGIRRLMTLTYEQAFFEKLGFSIVDRQTLPLKVWNECLRCSKRQACDEIAMTRTLDDVPELAAPKPGESGVESFDPPVVLSVSARRNAGPRAPMDEAPPSPVTRG